MSFPSTPLGRNRSHWLFWISIGAAVGMFAWGWVKEAKSLPPRARFWFIAISCAILAVIVLSVSSGLDGIQAQSDREDYELCLHQERETGNAIRACAPKRP